MKVVFFAFPAQGHLNPALPVISELVRRGERFVCLSAEAWRPQVEQTGAAFRAYEPIPELPLFSAPAPRAGYVSLAPLILRAAEKLMPQALQVLEEVQPDYVVLDSLATWGKLAAQAAGLPTVALITSLVFGPGRASMPVNWRGAAEIAGDIARFLPVYWRARRRLRRSYAIRLPGLVGTMMNTGQLNIVFTAPDFQPNAQAFDDSYKFVGSALVEPPAGASLPFDVPDRRPLIYISLGTVQYRNAAFYRQCFDVFGDYPGQFILSVGQQTDIAALGAPPSNFVVRNSVPQVAVLQRSELFITHGGMGSVGEGLYFGVPLLVIPQKAELATNALLVEQYGAGIALGAQSPFGRFTAGQLRAAVERLLPGGRVDPAFRFGAERLGKSFRTAGGYARAADEILTFARTV